MFLCETDNQAQNLNNPSMKKYLVPAQISKLDWILLKLQINSFTEPSKWDNFNLISHIYIYSLNGSTPVGLVFTLNKNEYLKMENTNFQKVCYDVILQVLEIIKLDIPEIDLYSDIYANFVTTIGEKPRIIAHFEKGKIKLVSY